LRFAVPLLATLTAAACDREPPTASTPDDVNVLDLFLGDHRDEVGGALRFLSRDERREFERGRALFAVVFTPETGLGPLFNANGCATCHGIPAVGGVGPQIETHATAFSGGVCEGFDELNGGSVVQDSATPLLQAAGIFREPVLPQATETGRRITPDLFGFGLLEAVAEEEILRREDPTDRDHDGISGRANRDPDGNVTRFGRKGQVPDLEDFIVDAFIYEQGITSLDEPDEQLVGGQPLPPGVDPAPDPEISDEDIETVVTFVRLLAPPAPRRLSYTGEWGRRIFSQIGCASCHTPALRTGRSEIRALSNRVVFAYTDLLLHDMGPEMADMCNGGATPSEFRTEPLMGLRFHTIFLHDGRATAIAEAIAAHGGEASRARERYARLSHRQRDALLKFLSSL
jgi:CxxC motif-containing protein (DUF1111 family)